MNNGLSFNDAVGAAKETVGFAGVGKYAFQASRAARGLATTTKLTAGLDLASGLTGLGAAGQATDVLKSGSTLAKGVNGAAKLSTAGKIAGFASKAAPIVGKASAGLGAVLGAVDVGRGIYELNKDGGDKEKAKEQIVGGTADVVTSAALYVAAGSGATGVGAPVAAVALGVAAVAQGVKYGYKYKDEIVDGAKFVAGKVGDGAAWVGDKIGDGASWVGEKASGAFNTVKDGVGGFFDKIGNGLSKAYDFI